MLKFIKDLLALFLIISGTAFIIIAFANLYQNYPGNEYVKVSALVKSQEFVTEAKEETEGEITEESVETIEETLDITEDELAGEEALYTLTNDDENQEEIKASVEEPIEAGKEEEGIGKEGNDEEKGEESITSSTPVIHQLYTIQYTYLGTTYTTQVERGYFAWKINKRYDVYVLRTDPENVLLIDTLVGDSLFTAIAGVILILIGGLFSKNDSHKKAFREYKKRHDTITRNHMI